MRVKKSDGELKVNGNNVRPKLKSLTAFVTQDDVMHPNLTVYEMMRYAAMLRVPNMRYRKKMELVDKLISELGLEGARTTKVGKPGVSKGISGGERKRLAIGIELLSRPSILFLDEPTSGLDTKAALHVMETIKKLACNGRTIVLTMHQPSSYMYSLFDRLILLSSGNVAYFGAAVDAQGYFEQLGYQMPKNYNPADFLLDTISTSTLMKTGRDISPEQDQQRLKYIIDSYQKQSSNSNITIPDEMANVCLKKYTGYSSSWIMQIIVLFMRSTLNIYRDRSFLITRAVQTVLLAVLTGLVSLRLGYTQKNVIDRAGALFFVMVHQGMNTLLSSIHVFVEEAPIFQRERSARTYRVWTYYIAKTLSELPLALLFPIIFGSISYWMIGFNSAYDRFLIFLLFLTYKSMIFQALGEAISCFVHSEQEGTSFSTMAVVISLLFGGFYLNTDTLPVYAVWIYWVSPFHYAFEALFLNEFSDLKFTCSKDEICRFPDGKAAIDYFGFNNSLSNKWIDFGFLAIFLVACKLVAFLGLLVAKRPKGA
jgi:ABC-type multidrug transport system ATPase subunit/ABC-type multidrug transport system permease subunit